MSDFEPPPGETEVIGASWLHNGFLALGCLILAAALFRMEPGKVQGAIYMAGFLVIGAGVILSAQLPGCTGVWLDRDGFLVRDMYKSYRYGWDEVGPFIIRRRLFGKGIEFAYTPKDGGRIESRALPRGVGRSPWTVAKKMNDWREWALHNAGRSIR